MKFTYFRWVFIVLVIFITSCSLFNDDDDDNGDERDVDKTLSGLDARPTNTSCIAPPIGPNFEGAITLEPAFPNLPPLGAIVSLKQAPGDTSNQWYATLQDGRIVRFEDDPQVSSTTEILNISNRVTAGGEKGLLGMDFHPDYQNNGEIYLYYSTLSPDTPETWNHRSHISRFTNQNNQWNEELVLAIDQRYANHNGGNILFGPMDGYLYIGLGDGGYGGDPHGYAQNTNNLMGSMLRIDVDNGNPYSIPSDNPFFGNAMCDDPLVFNHPQSCPETYAYGLRNPWRWSFDRTQYTLWLGDVGQGRVEEIDIIKNGGNYGWVEMEGSECYQSASCNANGNLILPVAEYLHENGRFSIVGGYVYRGSDPDLDFLVGTYLFSDTYSSEIFGTFQNGNDFSTEVLLPSQGITVYSFAEAKNGDLYVLAYNGSETGRNIFKIVAADSIVNVSPIAQTLSETGCFSSTNPPQVVSGVIPYDLISPLWSDGATKERYFAIPNGTTINVSTTGDFIFPEGSVLIKHFLLNERYVETRLLMHHQNGWAGYSYEWQYDAGGNPVDAQLLTDEKTKFIENQNWFYPSPAQCFECHTDVANQALGPETLQLNRDFTYDVTGRTANQLHTYDQIGLFSQPLLDDHFAFHLESLSDDTIGLQQRVKSYLHSNCSHCHRVNGPAPSDMDMHFLTALPDMNVCDADPSEGDLGIPGIKRIDPAGTFDQPNSMVVYRMESANADERMPKLATEINDDAALTVIKTWIDTLESRN